MADPAGGGLGLRPIGASNRGNECPALYFVDLWRSFHNELQVCVARSRRTNRVGLNAGCERGRCRTGRHGVFRQG
jgi:hypothetical protein